MLGRVTRHMLPHLSGVPHLHVIVLLPSVISPCINIPWSLVTLWSSRRFSYLFARCLKFLGTPVNNNYKCLGIWLLWAFLFFRQASDKFHRRKNVWRGAREIRSRRNGQRSNWKVWSSQHIRKLSRFSTTLGNCSSSSLKFLLSLGLWEVSSSSNWRSPFFHSTARRTNDAGRLLRGPLYTTGTKDVPHYNDTEKKNRF